MRKVLRKRNLLASILVLIVVCLGIVLASDVIVKEGTLEAENVNATATIEGEKFKSTGCTATGLKAVALGYETEASGNYSTAMGYLTIANAPYGTARGYYATASGVASTAMGYGATASGDYSTAMGENVYATGVCSTAMGGHGTWPPWTTASGGGSTAIGIMVVASGGGSTAIGRALTAGPANFTTAIGKSFNNDVEESFAVGFGQKDLSVESELVTVHEDLYVTDDVSAHTYTEHSSFYDKDTYGKALDYSEDSSETIKLNPQGEKEYNHEADPEFVQRWVTVKDYDEYTEEEVWDEVLEQTITRRIYQTHQELRSNLSMKVAWLRQCVFELKQENETLKDEIAKLKNAVGIE